MVQSMKKQRHQRGKQSILHTGRICKQPQPFPVARFFPRKQPAMCPAEQKRQAGTEQPERHRKNLIRRRQTQKGSAPCRRKPQAYLQQQVPEPRSAQRFQNTPRRITAGCCFCGKRNRRNHFLQIFRRNIRQHIIARTLVSSIFFQLQMQNAKHRVLRICHRLFRIGNRLYLTNRQPEIFFAQFLPRVQIGTVLYQMLLYLRIFLIAGTEIPEIQPLFPANHLKQGAVITLYQYRPFRNCQRCQRRHCFSAEQTAIPVVLRRRISPNPVCIRIILL